MKTDTLEHRIDRYRAFWRRAPVDRPILGITLATYTPLDMLDPGILPPEGQLNPEDLEVDAFLKWYEQDWLKNRRLAGDQLWVGAPFWGIPWMEAILGCPIYISGNTIWADHNLADYRDYLDYETSPSNPWLEKLLEFTVRLVEQAQGRYPIAPPLLRGPSDLISALRGSQRFLLDLYDYPDEVRLLAEKLAGTWVAVARKVLACIPPYHGGFCNSNRQVWAPGVCIETQEDAASMTSPRTFKKFFLPGVKKIAGNFHYNWIHIHSSYHHHIDDLLSIPELAAIEITVDIPPGPPVDVLFPVLQQIQQKKPLIIHGNFTLEEMEYLSRMLTPAGLIIVSRVESPEVGNAQLTKVLAYFQ